MEKILIGLTIIHHDLMDILDERNLDEKDGFLFSQLHGMLMDCDQITQYIENNYLENN